MKTFKQFLKESIKTKYSYDDIPELLEFFEDDIIENDFARFYGFSLKPTSNFNEKPEEFIALLKTHVDKTCEVRISKHGDINISWNPKVPMEVKVLYTHEELVEANKIGKIDEIENEIRSLDSDNDTKLKFQGGRISFLVDNLRTVNKRKCVGKFTEGPYKNSIVSVLLRKSNEGAISKGQMIYVTSEFWLTGAIVKFKGLSR